MKNLILTAAILLTAVCLPLRAETDSLFPSADSIEDEKPSLDGAINQFDNIINNANNSALQSNNSNTEYNKERIAELENQLAEKKKYLAALPGIVSRQFDSVIKQYEDADQTKKDEIAANFHAKWKAIENRTTREIAELTEQLETARGRYSSLSLERQSLEIENTLSNSASAFKQKLQDDNKPARPYKDAFDVLNSLSKQRVLNKVKALGPIGVKPVEDMLSLKHLDI
jgi:exonuclease VII large subunit